MSSRFPVHVSRSLVPALLDWFLANARDLPWRRTRDPYAIWASEIMLQQTQVKTVIPYFERWMRDLPDTASLASASSEKIHKLWEGLGYYTRVRNMQKAARVLVEKHDGKFPENFDDVLALPGIGRYTAGAICSIAFNQPTPILDGNVIRVLTRVFGIRGNVREAETNARLWQLARRLVSIAANHESRITNHELARGACSALNQSLMELGAIVCTPRAPACSACPVSRGCIARRDGLMEEIPNLDARSKATAKRFVAFVVQKSGRVLVRQRGAGVVNAQLWEFPNAEVAIKAPAQTVRRAARNELGCEVASLQRTQTIRHTITRSRIALDVYHAEVNGKAPRQHAGTWRRISGLSDLAFTSAHRRIADALTQQRDGKATKHT